MGFAIYIGIWKMRLMMALTAAINVGCGNSVTGVLIIWLIVLISSFLL